MSESYTCESGRGRRGADWTGLALAPSIKSITEPVIRSKSEINYYR